MNKKRILRVDVYLERKRSRVFVGSLKKDNALFTFKYHQTYVYNDQAIAIGPDLPLGEKTKKYSKLFISFEDRIPSKHNPAYKTYCKQAGISPNEKDPIVLVATIGQRGLHLLSLLLFIKIYLQKKN